MDARVLSEAAAPARAAAPAPRQPGILESALLLWDELRAIVHDQFQIVVLEARQAASRLVTLLVLAVVAALLFVTAWLGAVAGMIYWMIALGVPWSVAVVGGVAANLIAACVVVLRIRGISDRHIFAATLRALHSRPPGS
jgi:uncharacterized membrane protein YqjE